MKADCYNDANPKPVSGVSLEISTKAPHERVDLMMEILARTGWPKEKISIGHDPKLPVAPK